MENNKDKMITFLKQFTEGLKNKIVKQEDIEALHNYRIQVCENCERYNQQSKRCGICGCFMEIKTRSVSAVCPLQKW